MYTKQALRELGFNDPLLSDDQRAALDTDGFFIVEGAYSPAEAREMAEAFDQLIAEEGDQGGHEVHIEPGAPRVSNIYNKTTTFDRCLECAPMLGASTHLLGEFKLHGANLREPAKGGGHQDIHADVPKTFADDWWVTNGLFLFDDMTLDNGPTRVIPGSHRWPSVNIPHVNWGSWEPPQLSPQEQALIPDDLAAPHEKEVRVEAPAGSVVIINSALWHSGTVNNSGNRRRVLHLTYTRRDLPQQLYQRDYLTEALYTRLNDAHRFLFDIEPLPDDAAATGR
ncbi:MAG: phytanoyl-CoA dioxygenase family protein, partial [Alphaproteobacteria bacterium]